MKQSLHSLNQWLLLGIKNGDMQKIYVYVLIGTSNLQKR